MPMYDYRCKACGTRFEAWQKFSDDPLTVCPTCSGPVQRVIHAAGIMFKGSGFYSTDNKANSAIPPSDTAEAAPAVPAATADAKGSGDTKAAATPAAATGSAASSAASSGSSSTPVAPAAAPAS